MAYVVIKGRKYHHNCNAKFKHSIDHIMNTIYFYILIKERPQLFTLNKTNISSELESVCIY